MHNIATEWNKQQAKKVKILDIISNIVCGGLALMVLSAFFK